MKFKKKIIKKVAHKKYIFKMASDLELVKNWVNKHWNYQSKTYQKAGEGVWLGLIP